jgi:hypothetical protein
MHTRAIAESDALAAPAKASAASGESSLMEENGESRWTSAAWTKQNPVDPADLLKDKTPSTTIIRVYEGVDLPILQRPRLRGLSGNHGNFTDFGPF